MHTEIMANSNKNPSSSSSVSCSNLTWKIKLTISITNLVMKFCCRSDGTVKHRLLNFLDYKVPPSMKPKHGVRTSDITVDQSRSLWFRLFIPAAPETGALPVIVFFHGGGFVALTANSSAYDNLCRKLAKEVNAVVISVNYRLAPKFKYPCQYEDGFDVLEFIDDKANLLEGLPGNANLKDCFISGDSAGGNIAHHVAVKACDYKFRNLNVNGVIAIQPAFCGVEKTKAETELVGVPFLNDRLMDCFVKAVLPKGADRDHPAANVFGPEGVDISGMNKFPATVVIVGGVDPLKDWQKRYHQGLKKCGKEAYLIEYPNAFHTFYNFPELQESCLMISQVRDFVQNQSAKLKQLSSLA